MNPLEMKRILTPIVGDEIAAALARVAQMHKINGGFSVSVPSWALVVLGERVAEALTGRNGQ
jgi:hypothetical protein